MTQILPFVMFGIGLDDSFIIAGAYDRTDSRKDCVDRIHETFEDVGVSITLTSITSATAFALGCISSIPAVYWLCLYAFPTILIDFIYQVTFFVALIAIDERRVRENRRDCCFWCTVATLDEETSPQIEAPPVKVAPPPVNTTIEDDETRIWIEPATLDEEATPQVEAPPVEIAPPPVDTSTDDETRIWIAPVTFDEEVTPQVEAPTIETAPPTGTASTDDETRIWIEPKGHIADRLMVWYGKFLMQPWVKCLVLVGFAGLFSGFAYSASLLTQDFKFTDMVPDDSYVKDFFDILDDYSARSAVAPDVVFRFVDQSDMDIQDQMEKYVSDLVALDEVVDPPPFFWLQDFKNFTNTSVPFNQQLDLFLADPVYRELYTDEISRDENGNIIASRCELFMDNVNFNDVKQQIDALENQRTVTASQGINQDKKDWPFFTYAEM